MDIINGLLASEHVQTAIITVIGLALTVIVNRAAAVFTLATGIQIEARHREAMHEAIISGVKSAMEHGPDVAFGTLKTHVIEHLKESVPDALKALSPGDGVLDRLIERYAREALSKLK